MSIVPLIKPNKTIKRSPSVKKKYCTNSPVSKSAEQSISNVSVRIIKVAGILRKKVYEFWSSRRSVPLIVLALREIMHFSSGEQEYSPMTPGETAGLVIGLVLVILIVICSMIFCHRERQKKMEAKGLVSG